MYHMAVDRAWVLNTWDRLIIPELPFSRALMRFGKIIPVPTDQATKISSAISSSYRMPSTESAIRRRKCKQCRHVGISI